MQRMETLYAIGMLVGLMQAHAEPPKKVAAIEQPRQVVEVAKPRPRDKKADWRLDF
jgi:hypothetical protein